MKCSILSMNLPVWTATKPSIIGSRGRKFKYDKLQTHWICRSLSFCFVYVRFWWKLVLRARGKIQFWQSNIINNVNCQCWWTNALNVRILRYRHKSLPFCAFVTNTFSGRQDEKKSLVIFDSSSNRNSTIILAFATFRH